MDSAGWANDLLVLVPGYYGSTYSNEFDAKVVVAVMPMVVKLSGWVLLIKQFYARQPALWPTEARAAALRVAGQTAVLSVAFPLLQSLSTMVHPE